MAAGLLGVILALVLPIGIHNFYLGYTGKGIAQLILTITLIGAPIAAIWSFIEGIMILTDKNYLDADGFPLEG